MSYGLMLCILSVRTGTLLSIFIKRICLQIFRGAASNEYGRKGKIICISFYLSIFSIQELEKKFSETGAYKNLKKMLSSKNATIKELRQKLNVYEPNAVNEDECEEE